MKIKHAGEPRCFVDAGLGSNNPIEELYIEAREQFYKPGKTFDEQIRVIVSIGTGKPALQEFGESVREVATSIVKIAAETQQTANRFYHNHEELSNRDGYFRFNPPDLSGVLLDEASKKGIISEHTEAYGNDAETVKITKRWTAAAGSEQSASTLAAIEDFT